jgi:hypothetical protein
MLRRLGWMPACLVPLVLEPSQAAAASALAWVALVSLPRYLAATLDSAQAWALSVLRALVLVSALVLALAVACWHRLAALRGCFLSAHRYSEPACK